MRDQAPIYFNNTTTTHHPEPAIIIGSGQPIERSLEPDEAHTLINSHIAGGTRSADANKLALAKTRPNASWIEAEIATTSSEFKRTSENYVKGWLDHGQVVRAKEGGLRAIRAITDHGLLFWMVFQDKKKRGYHSLETCPHAAIAEAKAVWHWRREYRKNWPAINKINKARLANGKSYRITWDDALRSPLCPLGSVYFMHRFRLRKIPSISGRVLSAMAHYEPQIIYILADYLRRHK